MRCDHYHTLRLILGDQLNASHSWYQTNDPGVVYLVAELHQETGYVVHHVQKICAFFMAMAQFAKALEQAGHNVLHLTLDDTAQTPTLPALLNQLVDKHHIRQVEFQRPDEYRLFTQLRNLSLPEGTQLREVDSEHFLLPFSEITKQFPAGKAVVMEHFYRRMRKTYGILMAGDKPEGGKWNYDKENRQTLKAKDIEAIPPPLQFADNCEPILQRLQRHKVATIGTATPQLLWPTSRQQARSLLAYFCQHQLASFGRFQDAMTTHSPHSWSLYHSRLSFALNSKILHPREVIDSAIAAYRVNDDINLAQIEGFVRQILGWREYIRGMYWANMPLYPTLNALEAKRKLPDFFWDGKTKMACMAAAITQSLAMSYAHHIQRLMVTGNFCLLTGIDPDQVDHWYLGIYIDAIEWVEMPNTRGMALFADGGLIATKPYAASGNYINKMSDYCAGCHYNPKTKTEPDSCPFNSLYWHFLDRHQRRIAANPRTAVIYRSWDNKREDERQAVLDHAKQLIANIENL